MALIEVAAAVIERRGKILLTRRHARQHLAGHWEFPGGKRRAGESWKRCLARELREELGIEVAVGRRIFSTFHRYPDRAVRILFYACAIARGQPRPREGQPLRWVGRDSLRRLRLPAADAGLVALLSCSSCRRG